MGAQGWISRCVTVSDMAEGGGQDQDGKGARDRHGIVRKQIYKWLVTTTPGQQHPEHRAGDGHSRINVHVRGGGAPTGLSPPPARASMACRASVWYNAASEAHQSPSLLLLSRQKLFKRPLVGDHYRKESGLIHLVTSNRSQYSTLNIGSENELINE